MLRDEKIKLAKSLREKGLSLKTIAEQVDVSVATASLYCKDVLPKGKNAITTTQRGEYMEQVLTMYQSGVALPEIASKLGIPASTLYDWRRVSGLSRNSRRVYVTNELRQRISHSCKKDKDGSLQAKAVELYVEHERATTEIAIKLGVTHTAINTWLKDSGVQLRKNPTRRTRLKLRNANLGDKRYNWKGGITGEQIRKRNSMLMAEARRACFARDNYTCKACNQSGGKLNAHHIWPFHRFPEKMYDVNNLVTLCKCCHDDFHKAAGGHVKIAIGPFFSD